MTGTAGGQMMLGINLQMNARGVVAGAQAASSALDQVQGKARQTRQTVQDSAKTMGSSLQNALGVGALGGSIYALGKGIESKLMGPAINQAKTFETEMAQLGFVTQASTKDLQLFQDKAIETGLKTQFSPQEATRAMRVLRAAGLDNKKMLEALNPALDTAIGSGGMLGLQEASLATAAAMMKFSHSGEPIEMIMNKFAQATRETNLQFHDLPIYLNSLRTAPALLKANSGTMFALGGVLKNAGMQAAEAGMAVKGFGENLLINQRTIERYMLRNKLTQEQFDALQAKDITKGRMMMRIRAMKELGISIFDAQGKLRDADKILFDLMDRLKSLSGENEKKYLMTVSTAFTSHAKNLLVSLKGMKRGSLEGSEAFRDLLKSVNGAETANREAASAFENTTAGMEKFIQGTKETIQVLIGQTLLPIMAKLNVVLRNGLNGFLDIIKENPAFAKAIGITLTVIMLLAKGAGALILGLAGIMTWSRLVGPMLAEMGGFAGLASKGFVVLRGAIAKTIAIAKPMLILFGLMWLASKLWSKIWDENATGVWKSIQVWLKQAKVQWDAFSSGLIEGIGIFLSTMGQAFDIIIEYSSKAFDFISNLFGLDWSGQEKDIKQVTETWRQFGRIIGFVVAGYFGLLSLKILKSVGTFITFTKTAGGFIAGQAPTLGKAIVTIGKGFKLAAEGVWWFAKNLAIGGYRAIKLTIFGLKDLVFWLGKTIAHYAVMAGRAIANFIAQVPALLSSLAATTAAWWAQASATLVAIGPYILIGLAIAAVVAGLVWLALKIWEYRDVIWEALTGAGTAIVNFFSGLWDTVSGFFVGIVDNAKEWGLGLWNSFMNGLEESWSSFKTSFWNKIQWIRDLLPGSDAKMGPLSNLTATGRALISTFGKGAEETAPQLDNQLQGTLGKAKTSLTGNLTRANVGGTSNISKSVTVHFDKIDLHIEQATQEEAEGFVQKIASQLRDYFDRENEVEFA